jgi:hypothetical protein
VETDKIIFDTKLYPNVERATQKLLAQHLIASYCRQLAQPQHEHGHDKHAPYAAAKKISVKEWATASQQRDTLRGKSTRQWSGHCSCRLLFSDRRLL